MRAVFLDFGTVSHDDLDTASLERVLPGITLHQTSTDTEVDERIAGCDFILTNKLQITRARMRAVPGLRFIGLTATGTNNVDLEAARELEDFVNHINHSREAIHKTVISFEAKGEDLEVEVAMQWNTGYSESVYTF